MSHVTKHDMYELGINYTEPQKKHRTKKYNSQFSLHLYNEIVYMFMIKFWCRGKL